MQTALVYALFLKAYERDRFSTRQRLTLHQTAR